MNIFSNYTLNHCRSILQSCCKQIEKNLSKLSESAKSRSRALLEKLQNAINQGDKKEATQLAKELQQFCTDHFPKSRTFAFLEFVSALLFALLVAMLVRIIWFELYEIPTGSMRPTFKEQDHLTVSKTQFGINIPMETAHFYFDPKLVQRTGIVIFSGDRLPVIDSSTNFLGILPYKKRYIKRLMGKPGDTLYYYGGKIYGVDKDGNELTELQNSPWLKNLEYVPFISFAGIRTIAKPDEIVYEQTKQPVARLKASPTGIKGEIFNGKAWISDQPHKNDMRSIKTLGDLWGIGNFAMGEILTKEELSKEGIDPKEAGDGVLYLVLRHNPMVYITASQPVNNFFLESIPKVEKSVMPLKQEHLDAIMNNMYTARFVVKDGKAKRYSLEKTPYTTENPTFPNVADGTYEFYYGKAYEVNFGGMTKEIAKNSPLYSTDPKNVKKLYNFGINFDLSYGPDRRHPQQLPNRYVYFRDGDLYLLGAPVIKKEDPVLQQFVAKEKEKEKNSSAEHPYIAFVDKGAPVKDGKLDKEFIQTFGLKVPDKNYLVLGDNHAMSADSRVFGFVPEDNLQGVPDLVLWPDPGLPKQEAYPLLVFPRIVIWIVAGLIILAWYFIRRSYLRKPIDLTKIK